MQPRVGTLACLPWENDLRTRSTPTALRPVAREGHNAVGVATKSCVIVFAFAFCVLHAADKTVTNKELGFEITFPEAWTVDEKTVSGVQGTFSTKTDIAQKQADDATVAVGVSNEADYSLDERVAQMIESSGYGNYFRSATKVESKVCGVKAYDFVFSIPYPGLDRVDQAKATVFVANRRAYVLLTAVNKAVAKVVTKEINTVVQSFKILRKESKP